jgi:hypothetical protein
MHDTYACSRGTWGDAKLDAFAGPGKRVKVDVSYVTMLPGRLAMEAEAPVVGGMVMKVTTDGERFAWLDKPSRSFLVGDASPCNIKKVTGVPVPPFALIQLLRGEAPVLVHQPSATSIEWDGDSYLLRIVSKHDAVEEIRLAPTPADWNRPWMQQRVRVLGVRVEQQGIDLYTADLADHAVASTAPPTEDPDGLAPDVPPSGPVCRAEVPRKLKIEVPGTDRDMRLKIEKVEHNPPLTGRPFEQSPPAYATVRDSGCSR